MTLIPRAVTLLVLALLATPPAVDAQAGKTTHIGFLWGSSPSAARELAEAFQQGLRELGYAEGRDVVLEHRWAEGKFERFPVLAAELVRTKVDFIVAGSVPAAQAAKQATASIPIIMVGVGEAVETGLIASHARPGGNITGSTFFYAELSSKRLELLKQVVPGLARVAVLWNAANPAKGTDWRETQMAARTLNLTLLPRDVRGPADFERTFAAITRERPDALLLLGDPLTFRERGQIAKFAARNRLPALYDSRVYVEAGGLIAYGPNFREAYRRAPVYVDKILKGAKPGDLPVEQPTSVELVINLRSAKALGLTIPPPLLLRADHVIE
jgi:putative tryptophan/tyrosine transport system substrate-binding protein